MHISRKKLLLVWLVLTIVNVLIYMNRDSFQYHSWSSYSSLYNTDPGPWSDFLDGYPSKEASESKRIMDSVTRVNTGVQAKALHIAFFLYEVVHTKMGRPTDGFSSATPLNKYRMLTNDNTQKAWCGNIAEMYAYLCSTQGITCRYIEIIQEGDHHVVNEFFDPKSRTWQLVDLTHNFIQVQTPGKGPLNLLDFRKALAAKQPVDILQWDKSSSHKLAPITGDTPGLYYYKPSFAVYYFQNLDGKQIFSPLQKAVRYLLPVSWYDIYTEEKGSNILFYLKELFILLWLLSIALLLANYPKLNL